MTEDQENATGFVRFGAPSAGAMSDATAVGHCATAVTVVVVAAALFVPFGSFVDALTSALAL